MIPNVDFASLLSREQIRAQAWNLRDLPHLTRTAVPEKAHLQCARADGYFERASIIEETKPKSVVL